MSYRPGACLMYPGIACGQMDAEPAWMIIMRPIATAQRRGLRANARS